MKTTIALTLATMASAGVSRELRLVGEVDIDSGKVRHLFLSVISISLFCLFFSNFFFFIILI
jgi:hypothetical protein